MELMVVGGCVYKIVEDDAVVSELYKYVIENVPKSHLNKLFVSYIHKGVRYILVSDFMCIFTVLQNIDHERAFLNANQGLSE